MTNNDPTSRYKFTQVHNYRKLSTVVIIISFCHLEPELKHFLKIFPPFFLIAEWKGRGTVTRSSASALKSAHFKILSEKFAVTLGVKLCLAR